MRCPGAAAPSLAAFRQPASKLCPGCRRRTFCSTTARPSRPSARRPSIPHRDQSSWAQAVSVAQNIISHAGKASGGPLAGAVSGSPLRLVGKEMKFLTQNIRKLLGSGHPMLDTVSKYYTQSEGKHMRPLLVLLMAQATAHAPKEPRRGVNPLALDIDTPISPAGVLADVNPAITASHPLSSPELDASYLAEPSDILPSQRRLAEITELIHTASLLHDDVIDHSEARRGAPSANMAFGNKMAVLAGDFLLGRASVALARLRDAEVIELLATVIANLVEGEFMQLKNTAQDEKYPVWSEDTIRYYMEKTYLKSASLISKSCRASALLGESAPAVVDAAYAYGKNLGLAFQLVDDMLDYTAPEKDLGKPAGADLNLGLATAPLLFAWKDNDELGALVGRKFAGDGDVSRARELVLSSNGLDQTRALAQDYADKALEAIKGFPESEAKNGLMEMCTKATQRRK